MKETRPTFHLIEFSLNAFFAPFSLPYSTAVQLQKQWPQINLYSAGIICSIITQFIKIHEMDLRLAVKVCIFAVFLINLYNVNHEA